MFLTIITFILVLSLLVFVHEFGHFWVARRFGLKPKEFGFGFPPRVVGYYKDKEGKWKTVKGGKDPEDAADTIYSINWLPLGGFVNLEEDEDPGDNPNHFSKLPVYQRALILVAGVTMNIILAAFLLSFGFMIGLPQSTSDLGPNAKISNQKVRVVAVLDGSPAESAGLEVGDAIVAIDGETVNSNEQIQAIVRDNVGKSLTYSLKRTGKNIEKQITPVIIKETGEGGVGVSITETGIVRYSFFVAIWQGIKTTGVNTWIIIKAFYDLIVGLITGNGVSSEVGGPILIAKMTGDAIRMGIAYLINFAALLSINLAIINIFPFPALDGGRIIFLIIEKFQGKPVNKKIEAAVHQAGMVLLMLLMVLVVYKDIARLWN